MCFYKKKHEVYHHCTGLDCMLNCKPMYWTGKKGLFIFHPLNLWRVTFWGADGWGGDTNWCQMCLSGAVIQVPYQQVIEWPHVLLCKTEQHCHTKTHVWRLFILYWHVSFNQIIKYMHLTSRIILFVFCPHIIQIYILGLSL